MSRLKKNVNSDWILVHSKLFCDRYTAEEISRQSFATRITWKFFFVIINVLEITSPQNLEHSKMCPIIRNELNILHRVVQIWTTDTTSICVPELKSKQCVC